MFPLRFQDAEYMEGSGAAQLAMRVVLSKCVRGKAPSIPWFVTREARRQIISFIARSMAMNDMLTNVPMG